MFDAFVSPMDPFEGKKKTLVTLQWLLALATCYLLLFNKEQLVADPLSLLLIALLLLSALALSRLPEALCVRKSFSFALICVDTILIIVAITLRGGNSRDLLLIFFMALFISGIGESLLRIVVGCLAISAVSVILSSVNRSRLDSDLLFRIPFIFGVSILYGYLSVGVKKEKERAEKAEEAERLKSQLVAAMAHDIKNPLGVIIEYAEDAALTLAREERGDDRIMDALQRVKENAERIVKLVTGFLDASRAEAGDRKSTRLNSSHIQKSRMPSSA